MSHPPLNKDNILLTDVSTTGSAGVGRTGSFIVVDAMLDALRREHLMKKRRVKPAHHRSSDNSFRSKNGSISSHPIATGVRSPADGSAVLSRSPGSGGDRLALLSPPVIGTPVNPTPALSDVASDRPATSNEIVAFREHMDSMDHSEADYDPDDALMHGKASTGDSDASDAESDKVTHTESVSLNLPSLLDILTFLLLVLWTQAFPI